MEGCGQDFETADKRNKHERKDHRATNENEEASSLYTFQCEVCDAYLGNERSLGRHMDSHKNPDFGGYSKRIFGENSEGGVTHNCRSCPLKFNSESTLTVHQYVFHRPVEMMRELTDQLLKLKSPLIPAHGFTPRALPPSNLAKAAEEENWMFRWIMGFMNFKLKILDRRLYSVYLVGVLGPKYKGGEDIRSFIKKNPDQLSLYIGRTSCQLLIDSHHFQMLTPLSEPACRGQTIILLNTTQFQGDWRRKTGKIRRLEARMIEVALTDKEYQPVPGVPQYKILNSNRETFQLANLDEKLCMAEHYRVRMSGIGANSGDKM
ncbi:uncharacterized protein LOC110846128 [Folsomia candida]|nr:uncharacterized protein LOC110846128 [Folsomia candida]